MHIMTLKMKFIQCPRLAFFEKKSSRFIIVIIYIYIIYLIGLTLCPTLCLILCPFFLILKNIKSLTYGVMSSLNALDFVSDFVSHFVSHFVSDQYQRGISLKKHFQIASKPLNGLTAASYLCNTKSISNVILQRTVSNLKTKKHGKISSLFIGEKT